MIQPPPANHSPAQYLRATRILVIALVTGMVIFGVIVLALYLTGTLTPVRHTKLEINLFSWLALGLALVSGSIAFAGYGKTLTELKNSSQRLEERLNLHRIALIRYMALCEGAGLFSVICFFLTGNYSLLSITAGMSVLMISKLPARSRLTKELALDTNDQMEFDKPI